MRKENPVIQYLGAPTTLLEMAMKVEEYTRKKIWKEENYLVYLSLGLRYSQQIGNTHSAPLNGVQNWSGDKDKPRGYPGWIGRIWYATRYAEKDSFSNPMRRVCIHTGTGGGGWYGYDFKDNLRWSKSHLHSWGYDVKIFEDDWPSISMAKLIYPNHPDYVDYSTATLSGFRHPIRIDYIQPDFIKKGLKLCTPITKTSPLLSQHGWLQTTGTI